MDVTNGEKPYIKSFNKLITNLESIESWLCHVTFTTMNISYTIMALRGILMYYLVNINL